MGSHGSPGSVRVLLENRVVNTFVLDIDPVQVVQMTLWRVFRRVDACARNNHRLEVSHQIGKMAVTRRTRNFQMELEVASGASEAHGGLAIL